MAKMLNMRDFDLTRIGAIFELDEVTPKFETEERLDRQGKNNFSTRWATTPLQYR